MQVYEFTDNYNRISWFSVAIPGHAHLYDLRFFPFTVGRVFVLSGITGKQLRRRGAPVHRADAAQHESGLQRGTHPNRGADPFRVS